MHFCAKIHDQGQMLGLVTCSEHKKISDEPHNERTWRALQVSLLGQSQKIQQETRRLLKIAARAATFSAFAPLFTGQEDKVVTFLDDDEGGGDVNTTCEETASGHDLA